MPGANKKLTKSDIPRYYVDAVHKMEDLLSSVTAEINKLTTSPPARLDEALENIRLHLFLQILAHTELTDAPAAKILLRQIFRDPQQNVSKQMEELYRDLRIRSLGKKEVLYRDPTAVTNPDRRGQLIDSKTVSGTYIAEQEEYKKYKDPILMECQLRGKSHLSTVVGELLDQFAHLTIVTDAGMPAQAIGIRYDKLFFDGLFMLAEKILKEQRYKVAVKYGLTSDGILEPTVSETTEQVLALALKYTCDEKYPRAALSQVFLELYDALENTNKEQRSAGKQRHIRRVTQLLKAASIVVKDFPGDFIFIENESLAYFGSKGGYRKALNNKAKYIVDLLVLVYPLL